MDHHDQQYVPYSWHQSHDQATVLLMVPYDTQDEDMVVIMERNHLVAGVRGQPPIVKGRLYANIDTVNSVWQLEPRPSRLSARERTTSSISSSSTRSSYAFVSDAEISSSFAASLESGQVSDVEELAPSPALSSPTLSSADERAYPLHHRHTHPRSAASRQVSPGHVLRSMTSSYSSLESLHSVHAGRLLTLHLEKEQSIIWPSLITGPVPEAVSPCMTNTVVFDASHELEHQYNMDPTSLYLIALELYDIRKDKEESFEYFLRAWHQAHVPSATMRLATHYLPLQSSFDAAPDGEQAVRGTPAYYFQCIGRADGLARLYLEAGMHHLEGTASTLLSSSHPSLSSIRMPLESQSGEVGTEAWRRDREAAAKYFERARSLQPNLDIPSLPREGPVHPIATEELQMPSIDLHSSGPASLYSSEDSPATDADTPVVRRRRRKVDEDSVFDHGPEAKVDEIDNTWYLYIPGLVGAGTALLVVGVVGALSFSTWRRNQGS